MGIKLANINKFVYLLAKRRTTMNKETGAFLSILLASLLGTALLMVLMLCSCTYIRNEDNPTVKTEGEAHAS
jgi:hypothetical protein